MKTFNPPAMPTPEPVKLAYRSPATPAAPGDRLGTAALICGLLFIVTTTIALLGGPWRSPAAFVTLVATLLLPLLALGLGIAAQPRVTAKRVPRSRKATAAAWLGGIQLLLIGVSVLWPSHHGSEPGARVRCASNLRQIGLAIQMYVNDNKGALPPDLETIMLTQDLTSEVFVCPSSNDERAAGPSTQAVVAEFRKPGHCSYVLVSPLPTNWTGVTKFHVLAHEPPANHNNDGSNVLFGDGRVEFLTRRQMDHLTAELKAGFNPPRPY